MPVSQQPTGKNGQPQFSHDSRLSSGTANFQKSSTNTPKSGATTAKQLHPNLEKNHQLSITEINTVAEVDVATVHCLIVLYNSLVEPHRLDRVFAVPILKVQTAQPAFLNSVFQQHSYLNHITFPQLSSNTVSLMTCCRGVIHDHLIHQNYCTHFWDRQ